MKTVSVLSQQILFKHKISIQGKGWGPLKFIDRPNLSGTGFLVNGCVRLAVEVEGYPFD